MRRGVKMLSYQINKNKFLLCLHYFEWMKMLASCLKNLLQERAIFIISNRTSSGTVRPDSIECSMCGDFDFFLSTCIVLRKGIRNVILDAYICDEIFDLSFWKSMFFFLKFDVFFFWNSIFFWNLMFFSFYFLTFKNRIIRLLVNNFLKFWAVYRVSGQ